MSGNPSLRDAINSYIKSSSKLKSSEHIRIRLGTVGKIFDAYNKFKIAEYYKPTEESFRIDHSDRDVYAIKGGREFDDKFSPGISIASKPILEQNFGKANELFSKTKTEFTEVEYATMEVDDGTEFRSSSGSTIDEYIINNRQLFILPGHLADIEVSTVSSKPNRSRKIKTDEYDFAYVKDFRRTLHVKTSPTGSVWLDVIWRYEEGDDGEHRELDYFVYINFLPSANFDGLMSLVKTILPISPEPVRISMTSLADENKRYFAVVKSAIRGFLEKSLPASLEGKSEGKNDGWGQNTYQMLSPLPASMDRRSMYNLKRGEFRYSEKTDGLRAFLLQCEVEGELKAFFVMRPYEQVFIHPKMLSPVEGFGECLLDGELVMNLTHNEASYVTFDCLIMDGKSVINYLFDDRISIARDMFTEYAKPEADGSKMNVFLKKWVKPENLYMGVEQFIRDGVYKFDFLHHHTDGIIAQPNNALFKNTIGSQEFDKIFIYKYKEPDHMTIDLEVNTNNMDENTGFVYYLSTRKTVVDLTPDVAINDHDKLRILRRYPHRKYKGIVLEFGYYGLLVPLFPRDEKERGNKARTIESTEDAQKDGLTKGEFVAFVTNNEEMVHRYRNEVKKRDREILEIMGSVTQLATMSKRQKVEITKQHEIADSTEEEARDQSFKQYGIDKTNFDNILMYTQLGQELAAKRGSKVSLQQFHNDAKDAIIYLATSSIRFDIEEDINVADVGGGRGGDYMKLNNSLLEVFDGKELPRKTVYWLIDPNRNFLGDALVRFMPGVNQTNKIKEVEVLQNNPKMYKLEHSKMRNTESAFNEWQVSCSDVETFLSNSEVSPPNFYDMVSAMFTINYWFRDADDARKIAREIYKTLKPGGMFVAVYMDGDSVYKLIHADSKKSGIVTVNKKVMTIKADANIKNDWGNDYFFSLTLANQKGVSGIREFIVPTDKLIEEFMDAGFQIPLCVTSIKNKETYMNEGMRFKDLTPFPPNYSDEYKLVSRLQRGVVLQKPI